MQVNQIHFPIKNIKQFDPFQINQEHAKINQQEISAIANLNTHKIKEETFRFLDKILGRKFLESRQL